MTTIIDTGPHPNSTVFVSGDGHKENMSPDCSFDTAVIFGGIGIQVVNYGTLKSTSSSAYHMAVLIESGSTASFINAVGGVVSTDSTNGASAAVLINSAAASIINQGVIFSQTHGITITNGSANNDSIVNSGNLFASLNGIWVSGANATNVTITNSGEIRSEANGIHMQFAVGAAPIVVNSGVIIGEADSIIATDGDRLNVTNTGTLQGHVVGVSAGLSDSVTNNGTIIGDVKLGSGSDTSQGTGVVTGTVFGEDGNDSLSGGNAVDRLNGGNHDDTMNGGRGNDSLDGGTGNDTYVVDSLGDVLQDASGFDTVQSAISWTLGAAFENLTLLGSAAINATGNGLANTITGNAGNNVLAGGADAVVDTLVGLGGADTYVLGAGSDLVQEIGASGGIDTATTTITRSLAAGGLAKVENLTLLSGNINGIGNNLNNLIIGRGRLRQPCSVRKYHAA